MNKNLAKRLFGLLLCAVLLLSNAPAAFAQTPEEFSEEMEGTTALILPDMELPDEVDIPAELIRQETVEVLKKAIDALPSPAREIILLRYYHDMPHREIADVLNMNASTVRSVFQRSLAKLRKELEGYVHET